MFEADQLFYSALDIWAIAHVNIIFAIKQYQGVGVIPTPEQKTQCYVLCCWFTKLYLPINLVRMDERTGNIFFFAGEENIIEIYPNGNWIYIR